jgi:hypothetical protein
MIVVVPRSDRSHCRFDWIYCVLGYGTYTLDWEYVFQVVFEVLGVVLRWHLVLSQVVLELPEGVACFFGIIRSSVRAIALPDLSRSLSCQLAHNY